MLDFVEVEVPISQRIVSRLLGLRSNNPLRQLGESAGVRQAYVLFPADRAERRRTWLEHRRNCADFQRPMGLASSNESDEPQTDSPGTGVDTEVPAAQNDQENLAPRGKHTSPTVFSRSSSAKQPGSRHFTEKDNESPLPHSIFLLGTRTAVERMRLLLEFQADSWTELEELEVCFYLYHSIVLVSLFAVTLFCLKFALLY
ncbi:unnamed protein product [Protopolystoma xenopodis]|uniref:Uncharacterized protein n=1 Tax=Protopolystoma xenopodis TaxID=117903 RepID=A0A3S5CHF2_9PLAT|nr:unnamed protein product [Protopolystoma xenopodis]